jgi:hypothetical protein
MLRKNSWLLSLEPGPKPFLPRTLAVLPGPIPALGRVDPRPQCRAQARTDLYFHVCEMSTHLESDGFEKSPDDSRNNLLTLNWKTDAVHSGFVIITLKAITLKSSGNNLTLAYSTGLRKKQTLQMDSWSCTFCHVTTQNIANGWWNKEVIQEKKPEYFWNDYW